MKFKLTYLFLLLISAAWAQTKMTPEEKYLDSLREKSEKKIIKPEVYGVINYLSASSTSFEDLRKLGDRIYDLSASNKIKLNSHQSYIPKPTS